MGGLGQDVAGDLGPPQGDQDPRAYVTQGSELRGYGIVKGLLEGEGDGDLCIQPPGLVLCSRHTS